MHVEVYVCFFFVFLFYKSHSNILTEKKKCNASRILSLSTTVESNWNPIRNIEPLLNNSGPAPAKSDEMKMLKMNDFAVIFPL